MEYYVAAVISDGTEFVCVWSTHITCVRMCMPVYTPEARGGCHSLPHSLETGLSLNLKLGWQPVNLSTRSVSICHSARVTGMHGALSAGCALRWHAWVASVLTHKATSTVPRNTWCRRGHKSIKCTKCKHTLLKPKDLSGTKRSLRHLERQTGGCFSCHWG